MRRFFFAISLFILFAAQNFGISVDRSADEKSLEKTYFMTSDQNWVALIDRKNENEISLFFVRVIEIRGEAEFRGAYITPIKIFESGEIFLFDGILTLTPITEKKQTYVEILATTLGGKSLKIVLSKNFSFEGFSDLIAVSGEFEIDRKKPTRFVVDLTIGVPSSDAKKEFLK